MRVTEVLPATLEHVDVGTTEGRDWLRSRYPWDGGPGFVRLNMVTSLTGSAVGADSTSNSITNRTDRAILKTIRAGADVILVGAHTIRAEGYFLPSTTPVAVVTGTGDLGSRPIRGTGQLLVITPVGVPLPSLAEQFPPDGPALPTRSVQHIELPEPHGSPDATLVPEQILHALAERGLCRVVCEGGPRLASAFAASNLIDEYCVTVSPTLTPRIGPFLELSETPDTELSGALIDETGFSYLRLRPRQR